MRVGAIGIIGYNILGGSLWTVLAKTCLETIPLVTEAMEE